MLSAFNVKKAIKKKHVALLGVTLLVVGAVSPVIQVAGTNSSQALIKAAEVSSPDYLPAPQRLVVDPKIDNGVQIISVNGGSMSGKFTGGVLGQIFNYVWDKNSTDSENYNSSYAYGLIADGHNSSVELKWPNAGDLDNQKIDAHAIVKNFNRNGADGNGKMGLGIFSNFSDSIALLNDSVEIQLWFTKAGTDQVMSISGHDENKGQVYVTFGSLDAQDSVNTNHDGQYGGAPGRREFANSDNANHYYFNKNKTHNTVINLSGGSKNDGWDTALASPSNWVSIGSDEWGAIDDWAYTRGITFDVTADKPTYYVGTTGTEGVPGEDGVDGNPRKSYISTGSVYPTYNHLMFSSSTSIPIEEKPTPPAPTKTVSDGGNVNLDGQKTATKAHRIYSVNQALPTMPYPQYFYKNFVFKDTLPNAAKMYYTSDGKWDKSKTGNSAIEKMADVKVVDETGKDVTSNFTINVSGQTITATANNTWLQGGENGGSAAERDKVYGHTYSLKIDSLVNIDDQSKNPSDLTANNTATTTVDDNDQQSNSVTTDTNFNTPSVTKRVSVDNGATWVTDAKLPGHDSLYTYKIDYDLSDHVEYATLTLEEQLEDLQSVGGVKILDAAGKDVASDFTISGLPKKGANTDGKKAIATIKATAKDATKYRRTGETLTMILTDVTLKGNGQQDDLNYVTNGKEVIPNKAGMSWTDTTPSGNEPGHLDSNKTAVTPPTPNNPGNPNDPKKPAITKQVSADGGETWSDETTSEKPAALKQLGTHDQTYIWKTNFMLTSFFNFDGAGSLTLIDHLESLQTIGSKTGDIDLSKVKIVQGADKSGNGGTDITNKFNLSTKKLSDTQTDVIATVKAENADDFDDIGGVQSSDNANVQMIISDVTVKGATAKQELEYLTEKGDIDIPSQSTIQELVKDPDAKGDNQDYYTESNDSNKPWIRLPHVGPEIDKNDINDGDTSILDASDEEAASNADSSSSADSSKDSSEESSSNTSESNSPSGAESDKNMTLEEAADYANKILEKLDDKAIPYPKAVQEALDNVVEVAANKDVTAKQLKDAADKLDKAILAALADGSLKTADK